MVPEARSPSDKGRLKILDAIVLITIGLLLILILIPTPTHLRTCRVCGNDIRVQDWPLWGPDQRCVTATSPSTPLCTHPPYTTRTTVWMQLSDVVDRSSRQLERSVSLAMDSLADSGRN